MNVLQQLRQAKSRPLAPQGKSQERKYAIEGLTKVIALLHKADGALVWPLGPGKKDDDPVFGPLTDKLEKGIMQLEREARQLQKRLQGAA